MSDSFSPVNPALIDVPMPSHDGYPADLAAGDTRDVLMDCCGSASREFPQALWIEPRDWPDKARENDKYHTWGIDWLDRFTNQNPTHECTCHSLRAIFESARNRHRGIIHGGPEKGVRRPTSEKACSVWVSPLSVYAEANPSERGGAGIRQVLEIACRRGFLPETMQPRDYGFKHAIPGTCGAGGINQSRGSWVPVSRFPDGWQETAKWFKPLEVIFPDSWEQTICLLLNGGMVGVGRDGHAVPWGRVLFSGDSVSSIEYSDSYDVKRYDSVGRSRSAWSGSFAIWSVTTPDDWERPAG